MGTSTSLMMKNSKNRSPLDHITGLPTPSVFYKQIVSTLAEAKRKNKIVAMFTYDVDMFSRINNEFGREQGNIILKEIGSRFSNIIRDTDVVGKISNVPVTEKGVCRLGADSFGILFTDLKSIESVNIILNRMLDTLANKFTINDKEIIINGAFGISLYPHDGNTAEDLIDRATIAKRHAKNKNGRGRYQFYSDSIHEISAKQIQLEAEMYNALHNNEFMLHYQPIVNVRTNEITAVEALVRWNSPERGLIPPNEFIPLAESTGLIEPLGKWILRTACQQIKAWRAQGLMNFRMAVNISPVQFCSNSILESVEKILDEVGISASNLELEITESSIMENLEIASSTLNKLHNLGAKISLDDFGTGYSSLGYIKHFPIDKLKIDRLFLQDIDKDDRDIAIVSSIASIANSIGIEVVAEGVERYEQLERLQEINCENIQGFLICKPMSTEAFTEWATEKHDFYETIIDDAPQITSMP